MTIKTISSSAADLSILLPSNYELVFGRIPNCNFYCQFVVLPNVSFGRATAAYSKHDYFLPGEKLTFGMLQAQIIVDKEMATYVEMFNWMHDLSVLGLAAETVSNCSLLVANRVIKFEDVFPVSLDEMRFTSVDSGEPAVTFNVTFSQTKFDID